MPAQLDSDLISYPKLKLHINKGTFCFPTRSFPGGPPQTFHAPTRGAEPKHRTKCGSETLVPAGKKGGHMLRGIQTAAEYMQRSDPPADLSVPAHGEPRRSLVLCIDRWVGYVTSGPHEGETPSPTVCTRVHESIFWAGFARHIRAWARARSLAFLLGCCASCFITLLLVGLSRQASCHTPM